MSRKQKRKDEYQRLEEEAQQTESLAQAQQKSADADRLRTERSHTDRLHQVRYRPMPFFRN